MRQDLAHRPQFADTELKEKKKAQIPGQYEEAEEQTYSIYINKMI